MSPAPRVHYVSEAGHSGYALAARSSIASLQAAGARVSWEPMGWRDGVFGPCPDPHPLGSEWGALAALQTSADDAATVILDVLPPLITPWLERHRGQRIILHTAWESDRLPQEWVERINAVDDVVVPCRWNARVFRDSGVSRPVRVIPHALPEEIASKPEARAPGPTVFYTIGVWTSHKAIDPLVRAYLSAFRGDEGTELVIKTSAEDLSRRSRRFAVRHLLNRWNSTRRSLARLRRASLSRAPIRLITDDLGADRIRALHRDGDCYVSSDQRWAEPRLASAVEALRSFHADLPAAFARARTLRGRVRQRYSAQALSPRWRALLDAAPRP